MSDRLTLLLIDPDDQLDTEPDLWVNDAASYLVARRTIADALASRDAAPLRVAVEGARMQAWIRDLRPLAEVREEGLRARLGRRWGRPLPPSLTTSEIRTLGLDALEPPEDDLETTILTHVFGTVWAEALPSPSHLAALVLSEPAEAVTPWLCERLDVRRNEWEKKAGALAEAYRALRTKPLGFRDAILIRVAALELTQPPPDDLLALHPAAPGLDPEAVRRATDAVLGSTHRQDAIDAGHTRLRPTLLAWWRGHLAGITGSLADVAARLPGACVEELEALADIAEAPASVVTDRRLDRDTFAELRRVFGGFALSSGPLSQLFQLVVPEAPPDPDPTWSDAVKLDTWRPWLAAYLPYRAAIDRLGAPPETIGALGRQATMFSDWLTTRYPVLLRDGNALVTSVHRAVRDRVEAGERVLWVVWDNLPAHHADALVAAFSEVGLSLATDVDWRLALLPSVTAISFPAILAGRQTTRTEGQTNSEREALLRETFGEHTVRFQNTLRGVEQLGAAPADVSVVHFTSYDALLHKPEYALEDDRERLLANHRATVARRLAEALSRFPQDRPVTLVVTSDHGSTRLPPSSTQTIPLPDDAEAVEEYSSRAVRVPSATPSSDDVCTRLGPEATGLDGPVLLARGLRSWGKPRAGGGYVHGGALPEEVLVPLLVLTSEPAPLVPLRLDLRHPAPLDVGVPGTLRVTVQNPNGAAAHGVRLAVEVAGAERSASVLPAAVPAEAAITADVPFTPLPTDVLDGGVRVRIAALATVLERLTEAHKDATVPVQSALRSRTDDDIFDF